MHAGIVNVRRAGAWALAGAFFLGACEERDAGQITARQASPILSGAPSPSPVDDAIALVRPLANATETICTGTLAAPTLPAPPRHSLPYTPDLPHHSSLAA